MSDLSIGISQEVLPQALNSTSEPPPLFDGDSRLYVCYMCPFAQRPWIARNCKGLQDKIKIVAIDLMDKPIWYKERAYSENKVPSLEHNGIVIGESLDLIKYIDDNFEGLKLLPHKLAPYLLKKHDSDKQLFSEELLGHSETFLRKVYMSFRGKDPVQEAGGTFDYLEKALEKFEEGPYFFGQAISLAG